MTRTRLHIRGVLLSTLIILMLSFSACSFIVLPSQTVNTSESGQLTETGTETTTTAETTSSEPAETTRAETTATETASEETTRTETTIIPVQPTPIPTADELTYTVKFGDTLFSISRLLNTTVEKMALLNDISNPDYILPGQVLLIPQDDSFEHLPDYADLDNGRLSWWYQMPNLLGQDQPAIIPSRAASLAAKYNSVWQLPQTEQPVVYITMDAGYEYGGNTVEILDIAAQKDFEISFFVTGSFIARNPEIVLRMVGEGHLVGSHTEDHLDQPQGLDISLYTLLQDVIVVEKRFAALTGMAFAPYLRPPGGVYSERSLAVLRDLGYRAVFWSFAYADWRTDLQPDPKEAYTKIMGQLHNGSVLLLHTVSDTNVTILARLVDGIRQRGYSLELLPIS